MDEALDHMESMAVTSWVITPVVILVGISATLVTLVLISAPVVISATVFCGIDSSNDDQYPSSDTSNEQCLISDTNTSAPVVTLVVISAPVVCGSDSLQTVEERVVVKAAKILTHVLKYSNHQFYISKISVSLYL